MGRKSERMTIRLTKETDYKIKVLAKLAGKSRTDIIEEAIKLYWDSRT